MNTFDDYQKAAETTAIYSKKTALEYLSLGLAQKQVKLQDTLPSIIAQIDPIQWKTS